MRQKKMIVREREREKERERERERQTDRERDRESEERDITKQTEQDLFIRGARKDTES